MAKSPRSDFPFQLGTTQAARTLIRVHQLLRGEQLKHRDNETVFVAPEDCARHMAHIEAVLEFLGVDFDPSKLKPRRARPNIGPLDYGQVRAGALAVLKGADDWKSYSEVAEGILKRHGITLDVQEHRHFLQKLREALHALKVAGAVVCEHPLTLGQNKVAQRWRLSSLFD